MPCPVVRYHSSGAENFGQLDTNKTRANLTVTKTVDFEVKERSLPADMQVGPSKNGDRANLCK